MHKRISTLLFFVATILLTQQAFAEVQRGCCRKEPRWYGAISGGAVFLDDTQHSDINGPLAGDVQSYHAGFGFTGAVGYLVFPNIRTEVEISFRRNEVDKDLSAIALGDCGSNCTSRQSSIGLMTNAYYDFHNSTRFTPYIGAGIGMMRVKNPRLYGSSGNFSKKLTDDVLAYQFMSGISYEMRSSFKPIILSLGYRYVTGEDLKKNLGGPTTSPISTTNDSHNVEAGAKIFF